VNATAAIQCCYELTMNMNRTLVNTSPAATTAPAPLPNAPRQPHRVPLGKLASAGRDALDATLRRVLPDPEAAGHDRLTVSAFNSSI
jgi:hypothetical protein